MENEIVCVAKHSENILLFIKKGDEDNGNNPMALQVNLENHEFYIDRIGRFLKFTPFEEVWENDRAYYREMLELHFSGEKIKQMTECLLAGQVPSESITTEWWMALPY